MTARYLVRVAFSGLEPEPGDDPEAAAVALRRAGYSVFRQRIGSDQFIEASIEASDDPRVIDAILREVSAIADRFGGLAWEGEAVD